MKTKIVIDENLMQEVLEATGLKTPKEAVELGLRTLMRLHKQKAIRELKGKLRWDGNLDEMRAIQ
jgi:Arc/MetJ family transcription regulator